MSLEKNFSRKLNAHKNGGGTELFREDSDITNRSKNVNHIETQACFLSTENGLYMQ